MINTKVQETEVPQKAQKVLQESQNVQTAVNNTQEEDDDEDEEDE